MKKTRNKKIFVLYKNKRRWKEKGKMGGKGEGIRGREMDKKEKRRKGKGEWEKREGERKKEGRKQEE